MKALVADLLEFMDFKQVKKRKKSINLFLFSMTMKIF